MPIAPLPPLNAIRVFEAAARLGTFGAAAGELHVTPSAVSHQIAKLEAFLGVTLFERNGRRVTLNASGEVYLRHVEEALHRLAGATQSVRADVSERALTILASSSFASKWLIPKLEGFLHDHPDWRVRVEATTSRRLTGDADIGIFYGKPENPGLLVKPLVAERILVLCSPGLLAHGPPLQEAADLAEYVLIEANNRQMWRGWLNERGIRQASIRRMMSVERSSVAIDMAVKGLGIILESDFLAADELADGRLVAPFREAESTETEDAYFLAKRENTRNNPAIDAFISWIERETAR